MKKITSIFLSLAVLLSVSVITATAESTTDNYLKSITVPTATETYTVEGSFTLARCLFYAQDNASDEFTKIIIPSGTTVEVNSILSIYSNTIIEATGATIVKTYPNPNNNSCGIIMNNGANRTTAGGYDVTQNIYINGGTWTGGKIEQATSTADVICITHAKNVFIQNCTFENVNGGHFLELNAVSNAVIQNCSFDGTIKPTDNFSSMAIQIDIAHDCGGLYSSHKEHEACADHNSTPTSFISDDTVCKNIDILCNTFNTKTTTYDTFAQAIGNGKSIIEVIDGKYGTYQENITVNGNTIKNATKNAIQLVGMKNIDVEGNIISNCTTNSIAIKKSLNGTVCNNTLTNCGERAIFVYAELGYDTIYSTLDSIHDNYITGAPIIIYDHSTVGSIYNNTVLNSTSKGIHVLDNSKITNGIYSNTITNCTEQGISLYSGSTCNSIRNNILNTVGTQGIIISSATVGSIKENTVNDCSKSNIALYTATATDISSNTIDTSVENGIFVTESSTCQNIIANTVSNLGKNGVYIYNKSNTTNIKDNTIKTATENTIKIGDATADVIDNNIIDNSSTHGIFVYKATTNTISNNTITNSKKSGIALSEGKTTETIYKNNISNSTEHGITVYSASSVKNINNNIISTSGKNGIIIYGSTLSGTVYANDVSNSISSGIAVLSSTTNTINSNNVNTAANGLYISSKSVVTTINLNTITNATKPYFKSADSTVKTCDIVVVVPVSSVKNSVKTLKLGAGEKYTIKTTVYPTKATNKKVTYKSSNTKVVTVSTTGVIKGIKAGTATVSATAGGKTAVVSVTIKKAPTKVSFTSSKLNIKKGKTATLKYSLSKSSYSKKITFSTSNKKIVTVSSTGKIKGIKKGSAYVYVKTFNNKKAKIKITVK